MSWLGRNPTELRARITCLHRLGQRACHVFVYGGKETRSISYSDPNLDSAGGYLPAVGVYSVSCRFSGIDSREEKDDEHNRPIVAWELSQGSLPVPVEGW